MFHRFRLLADAHRKQRRRSGEPYLFRGVRFNVSAANYCFPRRAYRPALRPWVGNDPIGFAGGAVNFYASADNASADETTPPNV